ncbi:hypothetical protein ACQEPB_00050 [Novosphingobium fluoreni]|uniref:hypothetical protein n=1 Tax=Novosphingobium fluoreni TaxID=1391222 RepID=UPI003DA09EE8
MCKPSSTPASSPCWNKPERSKAKGSRRSSSGEHHHYPESTPVPEFYKETGVPDFHRSAPDPLITLGAVTAVAPKLLVGTSILLLLDTRSADARQPIATSPTCQRQGIFGMGVGWNEPELRNHGIEFATLSTGRMKSWCHQAHVSDALHRMTETS